MELTPLDNYILEIRKLRVAIAQKYITKDGKPLAANPKEAPNLPYIKQNYYSLNHYSQHTSNYEANLGELQELTLTYLLKLSRREFKNQLKRLEELNRTLDKFWDFFFDLIENEVLDETRSYDMFAKARQFFIVDRLENGIVDYEFISDFHDFVMFIQSDLDSLIYRCRLFLREGKTSKIPETPQHLRDIWTKNASHFEQVMNCLKETSATLGHPFIDEFQKWLPFDHNKSYLCAFIHQCMQKDYILTCYSGPMLQLIIENTFSIRCSVRILQSLLTKTIDEQYLDPFINLP